MTVSMKAKLIVSLVNSKKNLIHSKANTIKKIKKNISNINLKNFKRSN